MSHDALTQIIITGSDPRSLPEFSAIREEINKASHPSQPELNWKLVESLALVIFKTNGVDLHTATYYALARTRIQGLSGFCEGAELLAAMISHDWESFWPQGGAARTEMLDWFNTRTGSILRQQLSFSDADLPLLYRGERALQLICDKLQQVELKRSPHVENLLYFVQNTRKRLEPQPKTSTGSTQPAVRTLVYAPENALPPSSEIVPFLPDLPEMKVMVQSSMAGERGKKNTVHIVKGFLAGTACTAVVVAAFWWWLVYPTQRQLLQVQDTVQGAATIWLSSPELDSYGKNLQRLSSASPLLPLEVGLKMTHIADGLWPQSQQQQQATFQWNEMLNNQAQHSPQMRGWLQTREDLRTFAELLVQREQAKEGFTLSYIKTVIYQAERMLNKETPVEALLTQFQLAQAQKQNTDDLQKQINDRLEGVLSRWFLLKNNAQPKTANESETRK